MTATDLIQLAVMGSVLGIAGGLVASYLVAGIIAIILLLRGNK